MRRRMLRAVSLGAVGACLLTTVAAGMAGPGAADQVTDRKRALEQQIAQLRDQLEGTSHQFAEAAVTMRRSEAELVDVRARLKGAQAALAKALAHDAAVASQLAYARAEEAKTIADLSRRQAAEVELRAQLGLIARETYVGSGGPRMSGLSVALQSDSPGQFAERLSLAGVALQSRTQAVDRLAVQQADLRARGEKLAAIRVQVAQLKTQSEAAVNARKAARAEAMDAESRQARLVADQAAALAVIKARSAAEKASLDQLVVEQNKLAAVLAARARARAEARARARRAVPEPPRPVSSGLLGYPVSGPITSGFGLRFHPILRISRMHTGIDFAVTCGTAVYASAAGTVISSGWAGGYGNRVVIDHGWISGVDLATSYNHLNAVVVRSGAVRRGQLIAYSGTTGLSTGCHLHFEALANGSYVDPRRYL